MPAAHSIVVFPSDDERLLCVPPAWRASATASPPTSTACSPSRVRNVRLRGRGAGARVLPLFASQRHAASDAPYATQPPWPIAGGSAPPTRTSPTEGSEAGAAGHSSQQPCRDPIRPRVARRWCRSQPPPRPHAPRRSEPRASHAAAPPGSVARTLRRRHTSPAQTC
jgi:hypothetical protein